jgi:hypothetical protein
MHVAQQMEHGLMPFQHVHVRNMEKEAFENFFFILFILHAIEGVWDMMFFDQSVITPC